MKKVSALQEYENNPRNNDAAIEAVAKSIEAFGFKVPIVITKDHVIIAGHTRLKASLKLGLDEQKNKSKHSDLRIIKQQNLRLGILQNSKKN
ncbi:ParB N-terminal domain-containing protein [Acholeplasma laidlawii]|uniref:ParB-like nuclease domain protein n=1 Tax=Acholeplasma laidlawii (strain PG-8A) TaxID=441768 RepID=A9NFT1_ACHLI|nr:ParB N-terminal domain-containing protein [Acholeplasma laidlawii]ABX81211.1 ParB-like nuclease domain protein [Acholeplasma laidlawii PG-8A]